ncbi:MAG TPA: ATP cone domain-containing protein [Candidatus Saccharimonadales bacterium]
MLKRQKHREKFSRAKLLRSLILATDHLKQPEAAFALTDTIETNLLRSLPETGNTLSSKDIAQAVLTVLKRFDTRSYVKYLSYQTNSLDASELRKLLVR